MEAFLTRGRQTLDFEEISNMLTLQTEPTSLAGSSLVAEDEGFMQWTDKGTKLLISLYHDHKHKFADVNFKNKSVWEAIAKGMKQKNYHPSGIQCSNKWKQLRKSFVEVEDNKRETGRGTKPVNTTRRWETCWATNPAWTPCRPPQAPEKDWIQMELCLLQLRRRQGPGKQLHGFLPSWRSSRKPALHKENPVMTIPRLDRISTKNG